MGHGEFLPYYFVLQPDYKGKTEFASIFSCNIRASVATRADGDLFLGGKQGQTRLRRALRARLRLRQSLFSWHFWF